ncbi:hypothetical protein MLD38_023656 [Melastoma candidum]|uniref:Uncharacterized protein n=1 Tax=Melastoma candidum TaxID=119954 RepID=A0ACB9NQ18_9MYRT|nr:hypothetical protein MLD38_023656 [Melastoma candidum]
MDMNVVKKDLPPKTAFFIAVKLSDLQRKLYRRFLDVHGFTNGRVCNENMPKRSFSARYQALDQIWNHPGILQLIKEDSENLGHEETSENFILDDSSSDENMVYNGFNGVSQNGGSDLLRRKHVGGFLCKVWPEKASLCIPINGTRNYGRENLQTSGDKEGLAARVVDRQQVHRTISKEEMLHLFDFGDDDNTEVLNDLCRENGAANKPGPSHHSGSLAKKKSPPSVSCSSDKLMESLASKHYPRWITNYHEHETLLQENEEENPSKEEQDMAWEVDQKSLQWEEVPRAPVNETAPEKPRSKAGGAHG